MTLPPASYKLMRTVHAIALAVLMFFAIRAYPAEAAFECGKHDVAIANLLRSGFAYLANAVDKHAFVVQIFVNVKTGEWVLLGVDNNMQSCVMLHGTDFTFAMLQEI